MRKFYFLMLQGILFLFIFSPVRAQETSAPDSAIVTIDSIVADVDSLAMDSIDPDPEWYVAPLIREEYYAPQRATAANCPTDSILTFNIDSVLSEITVYEYGDTTRTMVWTVNPDGSRVGKSRTESASTSTTSYSATYDWDATAHDWKGTKKEEHTYNTNGKEILRILYNTWSNNDWLADTKYTWVYDTSNREIEYTTYTRNTSTNQLVLSKQRIREWYNASKMTLDLQYTAHNGTTWSAGTKKVYDYDASGNQIEYTYYSSLSNGNWIGSTHELWTYTSGKKTYYEKQTWSNGAWSNSSKEIWAYNGPSAKQTLYEKYTGSGTTWTESLKEIWEYNGPSGNQTLHEKYSWANSTWSITLQENSGYDAAGNNNLVENYTITNGVWKGSKKEEYTYNAAKKKIITIKYKWSNNDWLYNIKAVNDYDAAGNGIETASYLWLNDRWTGTGTRTLTTYNSSKKVTEKITQTWPTNATDWVNSTRKTTEYEGTRTTQEATYSWSVDQNEWIGTSRSDWHYNAAGQNDTIKTYTPNGTEWLYSSRTVKTYDAKGNTILTHNASWNGTVWEMTSMTKLDLLYDGSNRQLLRATWQCGADSIWIGLQKDTTHYSNTGKILYTAVYDSWANNDWVAYYKVEYQYDAADRKIMEERLDWNVNAWKGNYRNEFGYDAQGREVLTASYTGWDKNNGTWIGSQKTEKTYGENGKVASSIMSVWGTTTWRLVFRYLYSYDAAGREILQTVEHFENNTWVNTEKYEKEYSGSTLVKNNSYIWLNGQWKYSSRSEKTYDEDAQAKLRREITGSWSNGNLLSFTDKQYTYTCDPHDYTIRFVNYDGTLLSSVTLSSGETPSYDGQEPTKPADAEYTYSFSGWSPAITTVTGNATYTATYTGTKRSYTVTFQNEDGTELQSSSFEYGSTPAYSGLTPSKQSTAEYTYTFADWTPGIGIVTGDATYTATFDAAKNSYTITWLNDDNTQIDQTLVEYGVVPTHTAPSKPSTDEHSYFFEGWTPEVVAVTGEATYKATYTETTKVYTITWLNENGSELSHETLEYGATPSHTNPTKESTAEYTYTFSDWNPAITSVTGDASYTATFTATKRSYTIVWLNEDGTEISHETLEYGAIPQHTDATKENTAEYTYSFIGWSPEISSVTSDATYTAQFNATKNSYKITWLDDDNTLIDETYVLYGVVPTHTAPTKEATDEHSYFFDKWTPDVVAVTGEATYKATYTETTKVYTITWLNENGSEISHETLEYGANPTHVDPTKEATDEFSYTFAGWNPAVTSVTGDATYTATFTATKRSYTITWLNEDGSLLSSQAWRYGEMPSCADPVKDNTAEYTYSFIGWSPDIASVTGNATYTAQFNATKNSYKITWLDDDDSLIDETYVLYGIVPTHVAPTKEATDEHSYFFDKWTPDVVAVTGEATYKASYTETTKVYTITWLNENGTEISHETLEYGANPTHVDPTKEATDEFAYTFAGWNPAVISVTGDASYTATFTATKRSYTITWLNEDGSLLSSQAWRYGEMPSCADPVKDNTAEYTYSFTGWSPEISSVTGNATYTAQFNATKNSYKITWLDDDDSLIDETYVLYGVVPTHTAPTKEATDEHSYFFAGWTPEVVAVTGEATYKATYTETTKVYTITWLNEDGTEISHETLEYGATPSHANPSKEATDEFTYTFAGWDPAVTSVTGDASYTATFSQTKRSYTITWLNEDGSEIDHTTVEYGVVPTHADATKENTLEYTYTFSGWTPQVVAVTGDATYTATFSSTANTYTITWKDENGVTLDQTTVTAGTLPAHNDPTKQNTAEYTYSFTGWTPDVIAAVADATYQATFSQTKNSYTITFYDEDGITILSSQSWRYGEKPSCPEPTKQNTAEYTYTFNGWTPSVEAVTGNATYKATYTATKNSYTITWRNWDNSLIDQSTVEYGLVPTHADAERANTTEYTYTFSGWSPAITSVTGDATYTATFSETYHPEASSFTIIFYFEDGVTELDRVTVGYGETPSTPLTPSKTADAECTYTFAGWTPEIVPATENASYTATYTRVMNQYTVTFKNYNGQVLQRTKVDYGAIPEYTAEEPSKPANAQYTFAFNGWNPELTAVTANTTYTAVFESVLRTFLITFYDEDGITILSSQSWRYGEKPSCPEPTKPDDEQYTYTFAGWTPKIVAAKSDASYRATYTAHDKHEGLDAITNDQSPITNKIMIDNHIYILRGDRTYTLDGRLVE